MYKNIPEAILGCEHWNEHIHKGGYFHLPASTSPSSS